MSYARFSETSDVYVYAHVDGFVACCGCLLTSIVDLDHGAVELHSADEVVAHMSAHEAAGHMVPYSLLDPETYRDEPWGSPFEPYVYPHQPEASMTSSVPSGDGS